MEDALRRVKGLRTPEKVGGASPHSSQSSSPAKGSPLSKVKTGPGTGKVGGKSKEGRKKKEELKKPTASTSSETADQTKKEDKETGSLIARR